MKGKGEIEFDVDQFSNDVRFMLSAARHEDYSEVQAEEFLQTAGEFFLRPVSICWLSREPVGRRLMEQYAAMKKYFWCHCHCQKQQTASQFARAIVINGYELHYQIHVL